MKRVLMLATTAAMIEQFNKDNILLLRKLGYEIHVAGNFEKGNPISTERLEAFKNWIKEQNGQWHDICSVRNPLSFKNILAYKQVVALINEFRFDFIHCHTPIGSVIGRLAAHRTNTKIIYTAHGFHFYKGAPVKNWLLYYPVELLLSYWTDILITVNKEDYARAKDKFHSTQMVYIPGIGVDTDLFRRDQELRINKRCELGLSDNDTMILSVGELNDNKNHKVIIDAIGRIKSDRVHYYIAGQGVLEGLLRKEADEQGVSLKLMGFRTDIIDLYNAADIFILPSKREGLSASLMEAMATELPCCVSKIRGNVDLIQDSQFLVDSEDIEGWAKAIQCAVENDMTIIGKRNRDTILNNNSIIIVHKKMENIYKAFSRV